MAKKRKWINKWLIPFLAILVILQVAVLSSSEVSLLIWRQPATIPTPAHEFPIKFSFAPQSVYLKQGETTQVDLIILPQREIRLDAVDIILTFDPQILEVTGLAPTKVFSTVSSNRGKERQGEIAATFLEEKNDWTVIREPAKLFTLTIRGRKSGESKLTVLEAEEGPTTVVVESMTSRKIKFNKEDLKIVVK